MTPSTCPSCGQTLPEGVLFCQQCVRGLARVSASSSSLLPHPDSSVISRESVPPLFAVSTRTFILLSICTLGLYPLYWCYQNWKRVRISSSEDLSPFWRAVFAPLWGFSLFRRIRNRAEAAGVPIAWNSNLLATIYLLFGMAGMLPGPWSFISLFSFVAILPVQRAAQRVNAQTADTGTAWRPVRDSPADRNPGTAPPSRASSVLKPRYAALIAAFLGCWILMGYIGDGLANWLTPMIQTLLWTAVATTGLGLLAAFLGRPRLGLLCFALTVANLLWQDHLWDLKMAPQRQRDAELTRRENAALLAQAQAQAPCTNGDVAILSKFTNTNTKPSFTTVSIEIVPKNRAEKSYTLVSTHGNYRPPDDANVRGYRAWKHIDCRSAEYPSLEAMMQQVTRHYWAEHHKYVR